MTRSGGIGWSVAGCSAALLISVALSVAALTAASPAHGPVTEPARSAVAVASMSGARARARVGKLERHPVLKSLGIPPLKAVALTPVFETGFERDEDLAGFYVTPQSPMTRHEVQRGGAHGGERAHVAWLTGAIGREPVDGPNHRGYPTIQLQRTASGACSTPCLVEFWARIDQWDLKRGEWLSLATLSSDGSNRWSRVITVNVGSEGWLHLFHVPNQGVAERELQRTDVPFPRGSWVRITIWLDLDPQHGAAAVWQDGLLVSASRVQGGDGTLDQLHFGLYAPPSLTRGVVRNDDIAVYRVDQACRRLVPRVRERRRAGAPGRCRRPLRRPS